ncbi:MAG TPA: RNA-guided pseudouridylation complex pseudouridine synthase subunit Cbf5 [Thermoplasmata archaeon]|nr:RNA-guided pseudouridylation complex pseudouridine synthase subunit Cbf5 [Thermoplasmata archaeon]
MSAPPTAPGLPSTITEQVRAGAFLLVDKPRGPSSHQVAAWVREILGVERAGHAGTLDPNVSGLLWVGVGPALKLIPMMLELPKRYIARMAFHGPVSRGDLERVVGEFEGPVYQTPPVRSAVKRERRIRTIHRLTLLESDPPQLLLDMVVDSGTYVRTLAIDLGDALGVGAHLEELRRVQTGPFRETDAVRLADLQDAATRAREGDATALARALHPIEEVWREFPRVVVKEAAASALAHGSPLARGGIVNVPRPFTKGATVTLVSRTGELIAVGTALVDSGDLHGARPGWVIASQRVFADPQRHPPRWGSGASHPTSSEAPAE